MKPVPKLAQLTRRFLLIHTSLSSWFFRPGPGPIFPIATATATATATGTPSPTSTYPPSTNPATASLVTMSTLPSSSSVSDSGSGSGSGSECASGSYGGSGCGSSAPMSSFFSHLDNSWVRSLVCNNDWETYYPNQKSRPVKNGHYVPVMPTPLPDPRLVAVSEDLATEVGLSPGDIKSDHFLRYFSGDMSVVPTSARPPTSKSTSTTSSIPTIPSWCTPYALSIMGQEFYRNCPFGTGDGYGDGRAISIGEIGIPDNPPRRYEFQLKGSGRTPFSRSGDGRAVLRSSVREFLASEAMYHMNVSTTRAISLIMSSTLTIQRPWYSDARDSMAEEDKSSNLMNMDLNDPRLAHIPFSLRASLIQQLNMDDQQREPDEIKIEPAAITCRVATSFIRIGHIELFARRYKKQQTQQTKDELEAIIKHTLEREFPTLDNPSLPFEDRILILMDASSHALCRLIADWIRVGYTQGNFNSDNCLVAGRTMDYGPFGFIEKFHPYWNMWTGGGRHYSFMNQPEAAFQNYKSLCLALRTLIINTDNLKQVQHMINQFPIRMQTYMELMWMQKLGLGTRITWKQGPQSLYDTLISLMHEDEADYTILWRQLAYIPDIIGTWLQDNNSNTNTNNNNNNNDNYDPLSSLLLSKTDEQLVTLIDTAFYQPKNKTSQTSHLICPRVDKWGKWLRDWLGALQSSIKHDSSTSLISSFRDISRSMLTISPKYIPREWMLVDAYTNAEKGDFSIIHTLQYLFRNPYDEHDQYLHNKYYRKATRAQLGRGGTAFMS